MSRLITNNQLRLFLGIKRFEQLKQALLKAGQPEAPQHIALVRCLIAILLATLPLLAFLLLPYTRKLDVVTVLIALSAILCVLYRRALGLKYIAVKNWRESLSLTHTAFALGCIPAVLVFAFYPEAFEIFTRNEVIVPRGTGRPEWGGSLMFALKLSVWAGLTEELIFRFTLVSVLRRIRAFHSQIQRDLFAVICSAAIFGLGHVALWGPANALALSGIGIGFGLAYLATKEALLPVVIYHIIFDFLSIIFSLLLS